MVFLAKGCETCKKRRVKCDGVYPNCGPCQRANRICFGLEEAGASLRFVLEDPTPPTRRKSRQKEKNGVKHNSRRLRSSLDLDRRLDISISPSLTVSLQDQALAYYFHNHIGNPGQMIEIAQGHDKFLPFMWMQAPPDSAFRLATLAISHAVFAKRRQNLNAITTSASHYLRAVAMTKRALQNPAESCSDQILLTTMILSLYETIASSDSGRTKLPDKQIELFNQLNRAFCHHDGAMAVLRARHQRGLPDQRSMILDKLVRRQILRTMLLRRTGIPDWLKDGSAFGEDGISWRLDRYMVQVTDIQHGAEELSKEYTESSSLDSNGTTVGRLQSLLEEARRLDDDMLWWAITLPSEWSYETHGVQDLACGNSSYGDRIHVYSSQGHAGVWNRYRTVRVLLKGVEIKLVQFLARHFGRNLEEELWTAINRIQEIIGEVCESIPYCFNDVEASKSLKNPGTIVSQHRSTVVESAKASTTCHLAFPMHAIVDVLESSRLSETQKKWIRKQLGRVGRSIDASLLEKIAGT